MQYFLLLAFMLAYLAEVDNQLCLLQQGSGRMLGTVKMPVQLCLHPPEGYETHGSCLGEALCNFQRETEPRNWQEQSCQSKTFWGTLTDL